jgi:hypothetical protein
MLPRRLRGLLAAGLLFGVTVSVSAATWVDVENASSTFAASMFSTESNVGGAGYAANHAPPGPTVTLASAGFLPGQSRYTSVFIRTMAGSVGGTVLLNGAALSGADAADLGAVFVYRVVLTVGACTASSFEGNPTYVVGNATTRAALQVGAAQAVAMAAGSDTAPGVPVGFCFEVMLPSGASNTLQGKSTTAVWKLTAQSG